MILSWEQVAAVALAAGFPPGPAIVATAITMPESSRDATVVQADQPYDTTGWGLWQITPGDSEPQFGIDNQLLRPLNNGRAAHAKWGAARGFTPWTTYVDGAYRDWLGQAEQAVAAVAHLTPQQLRDLVRHLGGGGAPAAPGVTRAENWSPQVSATSQHFGTAAKHLVGYAAGVSGLEPRFTPPRVTVPDPATLLWLPPPRRPR